VEEKEYKMSKHTRMFGVAVVAAVVIMVTVGIPGAAVAASRYEIDRDVAAAFRKLLDSTPAARTLAASAKGILIFPSIVKGGFVFGLQYGEGALLMQGRNVAYYNTVSASYGLQAGVQVFGYALFLMSDTALDHLNSSGGFELGVGPSIVIVDAGKARSLTTTTARDDIYAFFFDQRGLMAGAGLQGTKVSRIHPN
jgi:lipid-binding SYLF domain-containing protein